MKLFRKQIAVEIKRILDDEKWKECKKEWGIKKLKPKVYFKRNDSNKTVIRYYDDPSGEKQRIPVGPTLPRNGTKLEMLVNLMEPLKQSITTASLRKKRGIYGMVINFPDDIKDHNNQVLIPSGEYSYVGQAWNTGFFDSNPGDKKGRCHKTNSGNGHFDKLGEAIKKNQEMKSTKKEFPCSVISSFEYLLIILLAERWRIRCLGKGMDNAPTLTYLILYGVDNNKHAFNVQKSMIINGKQIEVNLTDIDMMEGYYIQRGKCFSLEDGGMNSKIM